MDAADRAQPDEAAELEGNIERQRRAARLDAPGAEICVDCAEPIPLERRRALPSAIRCADCQAFDERVMKIREINAK